MYHLAQWEEKLKHRITELGGDAKICLGADAAEVSQSSDKIIRPSLHMLFSFLSNAFEESHGGTADTSGPMEISSVDRHEEEEEDDEDARDYDDEEKEEVEVEAQGEDAGDDDDDQEEEKEERRKRKEKEEKGKRRRNQRCNNW